MPRKWIHKQAEFEGKPELPELEASVPNSTYTCDCDSVILAIYPLYFAQILYLQKGNRAQTGAAGPLYGCTTAAKSAN